MSQQGVGLPSVHMRRWGVFILSPLLTKDSKVYTSPESLSRLPHCSIHDQGVILSLNISFKIGVKSHPSKKPEEADWWKKTMNTKILWDRHLERTISWERKKLFFDFFFFFFLLPWFVFLSNTLKSLVCYPIFTLTDLQIRVYSPFKGGIFRCRCIWEVKRPKIFY